MDIHVKTQGSKDFKYFNNVQYMDIGWSIGTCSAAMTYQMKRNDPSMKIRYPLSIFTKRCCLEPGKYTMTCFNKRPEGWNGAILEVLGQQHCNDFVGFKAMRHLHIKGTQLKMSSISWYFTCVWFKGSNLKIVINLYTYITSRESRSYGPINSYEKPSVSWMAR